VVLIMKEPSTFVKKISSIESTIDGYKRGFHTPEHACKCIFEIVYDVKLTKSPIYIDEKGNVWFNNMLITGGLKK